MAHKVLDNSSTHNPLTSSSLFFIDVKMFLFVALVYPLVWGWTIKVGAMAMCKLVQS